MKDSADPGLSALVMLLRFHGLGADPEQIRHRFGRGQLAFRRCCAAPRSLGSRHERGWPPGSGLSARRCPQSWRRATALFLLLGACMCRCNLHRNG